MLLIRFGSTVDLGPSSVGDTGSLEKVPVDALACEVDDSHRGEEDCGELGAV